MNFGIIIGCSGGDYHFAKGCLASVKYFMPEVPICLLVDGDVNTSDAEVYYGCTVLKKENIKNSFLRNNSFGWGITKMNCFWESPFDTFLFLDADVCMWGNLLDVLNLENVDMVIDQPQYSFDDENISIWFFDTGLLKTIDTLYDPLKYQDRYFCTGVFFSRKNVFDVAWYQQLTEISKIHPDLFKFGEMGMLNYMIFKSIDQGKLTVRNQYVQHICPDFDKKQTAAQFPFINGLPFVTKPMVIHYNGNRKPFIRNQLSYHEPMTWFRYKYYETTQSRLSKKAILQLLKDEDKKFKKKISMGDQLKNIVRPFVKPVYNKVKSIFTR